MLSREFDLSRQQFYSNPNYSADRAGKAALDALEAQRTQKQQEAQQAEAKIKELEARLKEVEDRVGPKPQEPQTEEQQRGNWAEKIRALRDELARVEDELNRMRSEAAAAGQSLYGRTVGGSQTADRLAMLERRRSELRQQIADLEEQARRAGVPSSWVR